jgi:hypothetical protein
MVISPQSRICGPKYSCNKVRYLHESLISLKGSYVKDPPPPHIVRASQGWGEGNVTVQCSSEQILNCWAKNFAVYSPIIGPTDIKAFFGGLNHVAFCKLILKTVKIIKMGSF